MSTLPGEAGKVVDAVSHADIVIGIPSYNNGRTIAHVVRAVQAGLMKYFPQFTGVIVSSDGGSTDGTREALRAARVEGGHLLVLSTPLLGVHRVSFPYHGIRGKGSALRMIFQMADALGAKACAVVDPSLRSITPEWIDLLVRPVLHAGFDFVAPDYHRHKYDGIITNSIVYPLTRALYGCRIRQPLGGDFGLSSAIVARYLTRHDWETDVARFGIDLWMTTIAVAEQFRVCQSFLGTRLHDGKDPGADLSDMLHQVVGSVFALMEEYEKVWLEQPASRDVDLFGFRYDVGLDPIEVNTERMIEVFRVGCLELHEIWTPALTPQTLRRIQALVTLPGPLFRFEDDLWVRALYELAAAHHRRRLNRGHLLRSLTPLYLARVASFVVETQTMYAGQVEDRIEDLCRRFEELRPHLAAVWRNRRTPEADPRSADSNPSNRADARAALEVES